MHKQLVPDELLQKADKILFITHLGIGDFVYMQTFFKVFSQKYPHIKIDVWVDEVQRTRCWWRWKNLQNYSLYDWLTTVPFFNKIYTKTYSPETFNNSLAQAKNQAYPIVVALCPIRGHVYAKLARSIAGKCGFAAGLKNKIFFLSLFKRYRYYKLNATLSISEVRKLAGNEHHISDVYAVWFSIFFGVQTTPLQRAPFVIIPEQWEAHARVALDALEPDKYVKPDGQLVFINTFAKAAKRCWTIEQAIQLIKEMKKAKQWKNATFLVNAIPSVLADVKKKVDRECMANVHIFTVDCSFFQLSSILSMCTLIVSVETLVIHLGPALGVPVVALMHQKKTEWVPWNKQLSTIVMTKKRSQWIKDISVESVNEAIKQRST